MAFGTPDNRKRSRKEHYRCSLCGREQFAVTAYDPERMWHQRVRACELHPDAPVLTWSGTEQGAAIQISMMLDGGATWDDVEAAIEAIERDTTMRRALVVVLPLMRKWAGELPERRIDSPQPRSVVDPLFGGPAHPLSSRPKGVTP